MSLVVALITLVVVLAIVVLVTVRKVMSKERNPDLVTILMRVKKKLPEAPGRYGWNVTIHETRFRYQPKEKRWCGICSNDMLEHVHASPSIKVSLVDLIENKEVKHALTACYKPVYRNGTAIFVPVDQRTIIKDSLEKAQMFPQLYQQL